MSEPIRVAHVIGKLNAAGVEAVVNNYYRHIDHSKVQFDYYIDADSNCEPPQELIDMGARYFVIPPYQKLPQHMKTLVKHFKENKYQIVHSGMNTLAVFSLCAAWIAGVPCRINHNHSTASKGETKRNILKYMLRPFAKLFATDYFACSKYAGEWLFGKKCVESGKVKIFNNAIDTDKFCANSQIRKQMRKELAIENNFVVGHIGRFCFQKNHDFLIDVFNEVHKKDETAILLLVGIGELVEKTKNKVDELGLTRNVKFLGARKDVDRLYQAFDAFVFPSRYEGLGLVGVEAQASGVPCIFSEAIPDEAYITELSQKLNLNDGSEKWANVILNQKNKFGQNTTSQIQAAGFDIKTEAIKLQNFYLNKGS